MKSGWLLKTLLMAIMTVSPALSWAASSQQGTMPFDGKTRSYTIHLPANFNPSAQYPVVMFLHGGKGNGDQFANHSHLPDYVDKYNFIAVFPNSAASNWNDGRDNPTFTDNDIGFLTALTQELSKKFHADPARIFVGGISSGGQMTHKLACEATNFFAGFAIVSANMAVAESRICHPTRRVPIIMFESHDDPLMPWNGGSRGESSGVISAQQTVDLWTRFNGCGEAQTQDIPHRSGDNSHVQRHDYGACGFVFYEIWGSGHPWPGSEPRGGFIANIVGPTNQDINATALIVDFFRKYGL